MSEVITVSSSEDEEEPPAKKIKIDNNSGLGSVADSCIILSDDECKLSDSEIPLLPAETICEDDEIALLPAETICEDRMIPELPAVTICEDEEIPLLPAETICEDDEIPELPAVTICEDKEILEFPAITICEDKEISGSSTEAALLHREISNFIDACTSTVKNVSHRKIVVSKVPYVMKVYEKVSKKCNDLEELHQNLVQKTESIKNGEDHPLVSFNQMYKDLKYRCNQNDEVIDEKQEVMIKRLSYSLHKIRRKVRNLEQEEVDFEQEENSSYMKVQKYKERAAKIYQKWCKYNNQDPHADRLVFRKLDFSRSKHPSINRAINKIYKSNKQFPSYCDMDKCIRKCIETEELKFTEDEIKYEVKYCFEQLGNLLQKRRKLDLYQVHSQFLSTDVDPASSNAILEAKLKSHKEAAEKGISQICQKYMEMQEKGSVQNEDSCTSSDDEDNDEKP